MSLHLYLAHPKSKGTDATAAAKLEDRLKLWFERHKCRPGFFLLFFAFAFAIQISPWWIPTPDSAAYLSIARSIGSGGPIRNLGNPHLAYPIGYPLLISPAFVLAGNHPFLLLSILHWFIAMILMLGVFQWARGNVPSAALLVTGLVMANVSLWNYYHRALSEIAFMAAAVWAVQVLDTALATKPLRGFALRLIGGGLLLALASLIRETGALFVAGLGLTLFLDAHRKRQSLSRLAVVATIAGLPAAATVIAFVWYDLAVAAHSLTPLGTHLSGFLDPAFTPLYRVSEGSRLRISEIGRLIVPGMFKTYGRTGQWLNINMFVYVPIAGLAGFGWWRMMRSCSDVFAATLPFYLALYVAWSFDADTRYMLPMLPVLFASLWYALEGLTAYRTALFAAALVAHLAVATGYWLTKEIPRARRCNSAWGEITRLAAAIGPMPESIATVDIPRCVRLLMVFRLDRPVVDAKVSDNAVETVRWIVAPADTPAEPGFDPVLSAGRFELLKRRSAAVN